MKNGEGGKSPHFRIGYLIFGLVMANMFVGVLTGRGKGHDFRSKVDEV